MKKRKKLIFIILFFLMFCYGFLSHKNKVFPYNLIKYFKQMLSTYNTKLTNSETAKIKDEYKNWNKLNINYKKVFIKKYIFGFWSIYI